MIEIIIYCLVVFFLSYLLIRGISSIIKGILIIALTLLVFHIIFNKIGVNYSIISLPTISNFFKNYQIEQKLKLLDLKILGYFYDEKKLFIIVKNTGYLPLTNFDVYLDENRVNIIKKPLVILPQRIENIEVEARNFTKISIVSNNFKFEYLR